MLHMKFLKLLHKSMKRFLSVSLIIGILLGTVSIIGVSVYAKQESDELQAFIDDTISSG